jgi:hypothetical protein
MCFVSSTSRVDNNFDLIHCDPWISPIVRISSYKYYLVVLDGLVINIIVNERRGR